MIEAAKAPGLVLSVQKGVLILAVDLQMFPRIRAAHEASKAVDVLEGRAAWNEMLQTIARELSVE